MTNEIKIIYLIKHIGETLTIKRVSDGKKRSLRLDDVKEDAVFEFNIGSGFKCYSLQSIKDNPQNFVLYIQ